MYFAAFGKRNRKIFEDEELPPVKLKLTFLEPIYH